MPEISSKKLSLTTTADVELVRIKLKATKL